MNNELKNKFFDFIYLIFKENRELKSENKHLNDLLNQALKELEELQ